MKVNTFMVLFFDNGSAIISTRVIKMFIELEKFVVNTNHIESFTHDKIIFGGYEDNIVSISEDDYQKLYDSLVPRTRKAKTNEPKSELNELFDQLHTLTGGKGKAVFSLNREKKLNDLLTKHRMTKELLLKAAENIGKDAFLQGENDSNKRYGDIDYLLRPDKAAKWSEEQKEKKRGMFE